MPAWAGVLSDKQISDVLTYVRGELGGNAAPPIPEDAIKAARELTLKHDNSYTEAELDKTPPGPIDGEQPRCSGRRGTRQSFHAQRREPAQRCSGRGQTAGCPGGAGTGPGTHAVRLDRIPFCHHH